MEEVIHGQLLDQKNFVYFYPERVFVRKIIENTIADARAHNI
jgi:hypothetical protein